MSTGAEFGQSFCANTQQNNSEDSVGGWDSLTPLVGMPLRRSFVTL